MLSVKKIAMLLLFGVIAFFYFSLNTSLLNFVLQCPLYKSTGVYCPGCGSRRAMHSLWNGHYLNALQNNVMLILGLIGLLYHYGLYVSNSLFKTQFNSVFDSRKVLFIVVAALLLFWILRNIPGYPFQLLAPL